MAATTKFDGHMCIDTTGVEALEEVTNNLGERHITFALEQFGLPDKIR